MWLLWLHRRRCFQHPLLVGLAIGVYGKSKTGYGMYGESETGDGVYGENHGDGSAVSGRNQSTGSSGFLGGKDRHHKGAVGVYGESPVNGVFGYTASKSPQDNAVYGQNDGAGHGVAGVNKSTGSSGILAGRDPQFGGLVGAYGESGQYGVLGRSVANGAAGFLAGREALYGGAVGVYGESGQNGVFGYTASNVPQDNGVFGQNDGAGRGVSGYNKSTGSSGFLGGTDPADGTGIGVYGTGGKYAGRFDGDVLVTGDIFLPGADCAEHFDVAGLEKVEPGTVMVINEGGALEPSQQAYDKKVAGVISRAGEFKHGIILDKQQTERARMPIALIGKVYCRVDAQYMPIEVGDLLTTSPTPGHAMKANDHLKAFGAVIGKALRPLRSGQGLIPILIALQ